MGAGAVNGQQQPATSVVDNTNPMSKIMSCDSCTTQFTIFKRKKICYGCKRQFCSNCLPKSLQTREGRQCAKCQTIVSGNFTRHSLQAWKVKDMRCFLDCHNIPTNMCREKNELIDLLVFHYSRYSGGLPGPDHARHIQELAERMREDSSQQEQTSEEHPVLDPHPVPDTPAPEDSNDNNSTSHSVQNFSKSPVLNRVPRKRLEDIASIDDIELLTVRQLKEVLANNFVDYKGCVEKQELVERLRRLWNEAQHNKEKVELMRENAELFSHKASNEEDLCKICMDATVDCVLLECGHMITCTACGKRLAECPICRQYVVRVVHTFRS